MQGIYINGKRPASKKAVREAVRDTPESVRCEGTSIRGDDFDGPASDLPAGASVHFVGPDPYTSRKYYGTLTRTAKGLVVK
jgi:hypothetical protein